jgi:hypothetical protein
MCSDVNKQQGVFLEFSKQKGITNESVYMCYCSARSCCPFLPTTIVAAFPLNRAIYGFEPLNRSALPVPKRIHHSLTLQGTVDSDILNYCRTRASMGVVEVADRIKSLLRRGRGYQNLHYLLLKARRTAVTKTEFVAFTKSSLKRHFHEFLRRASFSFALSSGVHRMLAARLFARSREAANSLRSTKSYLIDSN